MTTVADIIGWALMDAGIVGEGQTPSAEQEQTALDTLNQMMSLWQLGAFSSLIFAEYGDTGTDTQLPREFDAPMRYNLAVALGPAFSAPIRADIVSMAKSTLRVLKRYYMCIPELCIPSTLLFPRRFYDINTGRWLVGAPA